MLPPAWLAAGLGTTGASSLLNAPAFELAMQIAGIVAAAIGAVLTASASLAHRAATFFNARPKRRERTLETLKGELRARDGLAVDASSSSSSMRLTMYPQARCSSCSAPSVRTLTFFGWAAPRRRRLHRKIIAILPCYPGHRVRRAEGAFLPVER